MALRSFAAAPNSKWILKALVTKQTKEFSFKFILFFDSTQSYLPSLAAGENLKPKEKRVSFYVFYKASFIFYLYNAYDFLLVLGDFVALACHPDVEGFLHQLRQRSHEAKALRLIGCLLRGAFVNLWPRTEGLLGSGEHYVTISTAQAFSSVEDLVVLHSKGSGLFFIYRVLLKVHHFYSCFFFFCAL